MEGRSQNRTVVKTTISARVSERSLVALLKNTISSGKFSKCPEVPRTGSYPKARSQLRKALDYCIEYELVKALKDVISEANVDCDLDLNALELEYERECATSRGFELRLWIAKALQFHFKRLSKERGFREEGEVTFSIRIDPRMFELIEAVEGKVGSSVRKELLERWLLNMATRFADDLLQARRRWLTGSAKA